MEIQQKCREDSRIEGYLIENSGPSCARNYALEHAKGKWVAFCDADDWFTEEALETMIMAMHGDSCQLCACYYTSNCDNNDIVYWAGGKSNTSVFDKSGDRRISVEQTIFAQAN